MRSSVSRQFRSDTQFRHSVEQLAINSRARYTNNSLQLPYRRFASSEGTVQ